MLLCEKQFKDCGYILLSTLIVLFVLTFLVASSAGSLALHEKLFTQWQDSAQVSFRH